MMTNLILSLTALIFFSPILFIISIFIYLEDSGPIFFLQERIGFRETSFQIIKFRTMRDFKVTQVGKFLRQTGLDELPQIFNILLGDMNFVGPRPLTKLDINRLGFQDIRFSKRWSVKPGLTGLAQIYPSLDKRISICFDFSYLKSNSNLLNLKLIIITFFMNLFGKKKIREYLYQKLKTRTRIPNWKNWLLFFRNNSYNHDIEKFDTSRLSEIEKLALRNSLSIFQIGESGEGKIAKEIDSYKSKFIHKNYKECLKLFVKEEGRHARILANMISSLNGKLLEFNFTEKLFKYGRRLLGIELKLLVLLVAETISIEFYKFYADKLPLSGLRASLIQILKDEEKHLEFHSAFFRNILDSNFKKFLFKFGFISISIIAYLFVLKDHYTYLKVFDFNLKKSVLDFKKIILKTLNLTISKKDNLNFKLEIKLV